MTAQCGRRCLPSCFRPMKGDLFETVMEERTKSSRQHPMRPPMGLTMSVPDTHTLQRDAVSKPLSIHLAVSLSNYPLLLTSSPPPILSTSHRPPRLIYPERLPQDLSNPLTSRCPESTPCRPLSNH